ncbi:LysR family transcriptional regulator [Neiella marina]|uniref:LysR family transcriptional regulator n=1 Tax=Neiella marina TaxID=508461 RepID=A0A8J2U7H6_9GAMM|nr:LysR family transcriptional regulator [Neiella marina]GGA83961.1 LysR family transcriptional regulator [Neiella marina]
MDRLETMQVFVEVAKHKSFVAASEQLNLSAPAVTRAIAALENRLEVKLFHRTTRHVRLTEAGERYLTDAKRILDDIEESEAAAAGLYATPSGVLTITAPVLFGEMHVMPIVAEYMRRYPDVSVRAIFSDRVTSLQEDELDIAIRIGHLKDSSLFATQVGSVRRIIVGSPDYFQQHGIPCSPSELSKHQIIFPTMYSPSANWGFVVDGKKQILKLSPRLHCFQGGAAIKAVMLGAGITRVMSYQVGDKLADGSLQRILTEFEEPPLPVNILRLEGRRMNAKIRSFLDLASERLKVNPYIREQ